MLAPTPGPAAMSQIRYVSLWRTAEPEATPLPNLQPLEEAPGSITSTEGYDLLAEIAVDIRLPRYEVEYSKAKRDGAYFAEMGSALTRMGFRLMEHCQRRGLKPPTEFVLEHVFREVLMREADPLSRLVGIDRTHRAATSAAFVLQEWSPEHKAVLAEKGRRGGQKSKRKPLHDPSLLDGLFGLSVREQAARLGLSKSTVARLRERHWFYQEPSLPRKE
ncbi:hypothetical protein [Agrococcus sediminis]|uniref:hypothetical protein n=1 Tax=Agrococcus sediminis TaxID=2599924 RepID=UPI0034320B0A